VQRAGRFGHKSSVPGWSFEYRRTSSTWVDIAGPAVAFGSVHVPATP
jgi:hypothetical protein